MPTSRPPEFLLPCLYSIELAVVNTYKEHPQVKDKDVEDIYDQFKDFYRKLSQGKELYEPESTVAARQALIDRILEALDRRADQGADAHLIMNENVHPGGFPIPNVEALYSMCFNQLIGSVRFWRKERGLKGYLKFITEQMPDSGE